MRPWILAQLPMVREGLPARCAEAAALLDDAVEDVLVFPHLPLEHQG